MVASIALLVALVPLAVQATPDLVARQLSEADVLRYKQIFELQERGDWRRADRIVQVLEDRRLIGRVLFQRYMHPTKYRSSYKELSAWMKSYADQPGANQIYRLALRKRPKGYKSPQHPVIASAPRVEAEPDQTSPPPTKRSARHRQLVNNIQCAVAQQISSGNPKAAESRINRKDACRW
ncbi:MAG: hypothetical protein O3A21_01755, partial [Proteobacteria bacterium]|nr:hypothetical protein [Pseudomonadota bacterium]